MTRPDFAPGFRLSPSDIVVLLLGIAAAGGLLMVATWAAYVVAFVVGHFFLFCNVFRVSRSLELSWGVLFTLLASTTATTGYPGWAATTVAALVATAIAVMLEMRKPSYHGVFWWRVNPRLPDWWDAEDAGWRAK